MPNFFKHIIIGSGAGGSIAAHELSKKTSNIAIIEEGRSYDASYFKSKKIATRNKNLWRNGGTTAFIGKTIIPYAEGVALGGSTISNGGIVERPSHEWIEGLKNNYSLDGFEHNQMDRIFSEIEQKLNVNQENDYGNEYNLDSKIWINYLNRMKISYRNSNLAHSNCIKTNECISGCPRNAKLTNVSLNYLPEAKKNGVEIFAQNRVIKIKKNGRLWEVQTKHKDRKFIFTCEFLHFATGAIQTPILLKKNGFLNKFGNKLNFHLNYQILSKFKNPVNSENGTIFTTDIDHYKNTGISFNPANFKKSYLFSKFSNLNNDKINLIEKNINFYGIYISQLKVDGYASIKKNLFGQPIITFKLLESDLIRIKKSMKLIFDILLGSGAEELILPYDNFKSLSSKNDLNNLVDNFNLSKMNFVCAHMMSSCSLGNRPYDIVDGSGSLFSEKTIKIVDASVIPQSPGESPQLTIMSTAKRIIEMNEHKNF